MAPYMLVPRETILTFIILRKQEFLSDLTVQVFLPIGIILRNQTMKKFAKNWISSTRLYMLVRGAAEKMRKQFNSFPPVVNQVDPCAKEQRISIIELREIKTEVNFVRS